MTDCIGWPVRNWRRGLFTDRSSFSVYHDGRRATVRTDGAAGVLWFSVECSDCHGRNGPVVLNHWGRVTHICVSKLTIIGSDNGLSPGRRQAIVWTNAGILLIRTLGTNFSEILVEIHSFSFSKKHLKRSSAKWRLFDLCLNELNDTFNAQRYVDEVIQLEFVPYVQGHGWIFQHHNTFPHAVRLTHEFMRANAVRLLAWPSYSPTCPHWAPGRLQCLSDKPKWPTPTNRVAVLSGSPEGLGWHLTSKNYPSHPAHAAEMQNNAWGWLHPLLNWLHFMVWCTKQHATVNLC